LFQKIKYQYLQLLCIAVIFLLFSLPSVKIGFSIISDPRPPEQPLEGPGGSNYSHEQVQRFRYGVGVHQYWIFEPLCPQPETAPLIIFNHGWLAIHPLIYQEWIDHLVRKGNIVIYPRYQFGPLYGYQRFANNAVDAVTAALKELEKNNHVHPDLDKVAIVGHSLGGGITVYMAAVAQQGHLPIPKAIMPVQPALPFGATIDFSLISNETFMLVVVGEDDDIVENDSALIIFYETPQISLTNKDYIIQRTDTYGTPDLLADHGAPLCLPFFGTTDAMDYYSTWKLFDALTDYAFYGVNREYCFDNTPEQRFMGLWSDGTPVTELVVTDNP